MTSLDDRLRAVPFFRALPGPDLAAISEQLKLRTFRRGTILFREGDTADAMYLVDSGQLEVLRGDQDQPIALLGAGSVAGELALLLGEPRSATLRAGSACRVWCLSREDLDRLLLAHPAIALELSAELGRRLVTTTRRLNQGDVTRFTAGFGQCANAVAGAIAAEGLKVGLLTLRKVPVPDAVTALTPVEFSPDGLARLSGQRFRDLDHVVVSVPRTRDALAAVAVDVSTWAVADGELPGWAARRQPLERVLRVDADNPNDVATAARRVSGRAVALALSSGGSKTVAHLGVIAALRDRRVQIDAVAGTSGGAIAAVAVAANAPTAEIRRYVDELGTQLRPRKWDVHLLPRTALMRGRRLRDMFERWFEGREFSDLQMPLYIVASDMTTGEEVVITEGSLADAVRASLSIPGAFDPWRHQGRLLIDGGVTNPLPAAPLRQAGYERIIASNVAGKDADPQAEPGARLPNILTVMLRTINLMEAEVIKAHLPLADVVVRPHVKANGSFDFTQVDAFLDEGRAAVERQESELIRQGFLAPAAAAGQADRG